MRRLPTCPPAVCFGAPFRSSNTLGKKIAKTGGTYCVTSRRPPSASTSCRARDSPSPSPVLRFPLTDRSNSRGATDSGIPWPSSATSMMALRPAVASHDRDRPRAVDEGVLQQHRKRLRQPAWGRRHDKARSPVDHDGAIDLSVWEAPFLDLLLDRRVKGQPHCRRVVATAAVIEQVRRQRRSAARSGRGRCLPPP